MEVPWRTVSLRFEGAVPEAREMGFWVLGSLAEFEQAFGTREFRPAIDFERELLVVLHRGFCPTGGYAIDVESVVAEGSRIWVTVKLQDPPRGAMVLMIITYPRAEFTLAKGDLPPVPLQFVFGDRAGGELGEVEYFPPGAGKLG